VAEPRLQDEASLIAGVEGGLTNIHTLVLRSLVRSVPRLRMLDEHHLRSLGKLVARNLDRIADIDNIRN
jgi:hypothetical protein